MDAFYFCFSLRSGVLERREGERTTAVSLGYEWREPHWLPGQQGGNQVPPGADTNRKDAPWAAEGLATSLLRRRGTAEQRAAWGFLGDQLRPFLEPQPHLLLSFRVRRLPLWGQSDPVTPGPAEGRGWRWAQELGGCVHLGMRSAPSPPASICLPSSPCLSSLGQGRKWTFFLLEKLSNLRGKACRPWHLGSSLNTRGTATRQQATANQTVSSQWSWDI